MSLVTARRAITYPNPDRSDRPDIPAFFGDIIPFLDADVVYNQGTDAARIAAAHQTGGGRFWWTTDTGLVWYDDGAAWHQVGVSEAVVTADTNRYGTHAARPAANAVNAGTIYWESDTRQAFRSDGANWIGPINAGAQLDYAQITADVNTATTATTESTATTVLTGNSTTFDGSRVKVEFWAPGASAISGSGATVFYIALFRDAVAIGRAAFPQSAAGGGDESVYAQMYDTPTAAAHTYVAKAYSAGGTNPSIAIRAGAGGASAYHPAYLRTTKA